MRRMLHRLFLRLRPIGAIQLYRVERWYAGYHPVGRSRLRRERSTGFCPAYQRNPDRTNKTA